MQFATTTGFFMDLEVVPESLDPTVVVAARSHNKYYHYATIVVLDSFFPPSDIPTSE